MAAARLPANIFKGGQRYLFKAKQCGSLCISRQTLWNPKQIIIWFGNGRSEWIIFVLAFVKVTSDDNNIFLLVNDASSFWRYYFYKYIRVLFIKYVRWYVLFQNKLSNLKTRRTMMDKWFIRVRFFLGEFFSFMTNIKRLILFFLFHVSCN